MGFSSVNSGFSGASTGGGGGGGTVTEVFAGNLSPIFTTNVVSPTTTPVIQFALNNQSANLVFAGPTSGGAAAPQFRSLVAADIPNVFTGATGDLISFSATDTKSNISAVATGYLLGSQGTSTKPAWLQAATLNTSLTTPILIGGTGTGSSAEIRSTSGVGATDFIKFTVGNNGATEAARILNGGALLVGGTSLVSPPAGAELLSVQKNQNASTVQVISNTNSGASSASILSLYNSASLYTNISQFSSGYTDGGNLNKPNGAALAQIGSGGFSFGSASGALRFYSGGVSDATNLRLTMASNGVCTWNKGYNVFPAATATAGTAPIKFTTGGTLLTTPEEGAIETASDKIYYTIPTGTARKEFTLNDAALTSTYIPVATTNGRIKNSLFIDDGTNLLIPTSGGGGGLGGNGIAASGAAAGYGRIDFGYDGDNTSVLISSDQAVRAEGWVEVNSNVATLAYGTAGQILCTSFGVQTVGLLTVPTDIDISATATTIRMHFGSTGDMFNDATLSSGTVAVTISGLTTGDRAFIQLTTPGGTLGTHYKAVCTANTLTITAVDTAGSTVTSDTSTLTYHIIKKSN